MPVLRFARALALGSLCLALANGCRSAPEDAFVRLHDDFDLIGSYMQPAWLDQPAHEIVLHAGGTFEWWSQGGKLMPTDPIALGCGTWRRYGDRVRLSALSNELSQIGTFVEGDFFVMNHGERFVLVPAEKIGSVLATGLTQETCFFPAQLARSIPSTWALTATPPSRP